MIVRVRFHAQLRQKVGQVTQTVALPSGATIHYLLGQLARTHPAAGALLLEAAGKKSPSLLVFVGDEQATADQPLAEGDEIILMTPIAGGGLPCLPGA
ncbi:MAG: MoaD/ThiS family protein [Gemmataceae bacterium]